MPTTSTTINYNNDNLNSTQVGTKTTNTHQRHSSSTFIAHLLVQEYPPKVQPRSSSARDKALFGHLDRVDAEAGCILIALANHDKRKDMNDLIPYSIRVIDYNQIATEPTMESTNGDSNSSNSSTSDSASPHTDNEDPTTTSTSTMTMKDENDNNGTMSITNLIGSMSSSTTEDPALVKSGVPYQYSSTSNQQQSVATNSIPSSTSLTATTIANETHINNNNIHDPSSQKQSSWKRKPKTDPILLLAAAAKAIDQDEHLQQRANQKRKYSDDDSSLDSPAGRPRHSAEDSQAVVDQRQSEKTKFSYQYLSMKQNPKIKRNAMHAYITYMIYTDLASSDKVMYQHDKGSYHQHHQQSEDISATGPPLSLPSASITTSYAPLPPSPHPTTTTITTTSSNHRGTTTTGASSSSTSASLTFEHQYPQHTHSSKHHSYTSRINIPASGTTGTNASSSENHTSSFTNNTWPYGIATPSTSIPPTSSPPAPSLIHSGPSSIMARPLTAFLRDDMYS